MKCPKCSYVSFEYLNSCKKCGIELSSHKAAHSIDFPQYSDLGILAMIQAEEPAAVVIEDAVAVAEDDGEVSDIGGSAAEEVSEGGLDLSSMGGQVEETTASVDVADMGDSAVELELPSEDTGEIKGPDDSAGIDLSGVGDSPEETASISLEDTGQETTAEISIEPEEKTPDVEEAAVGDGEGIALDLGEVEPVEAASQEPGIGEETAEPESAEGKTDTTTQDLDSTDEIEALDLGDMEDIDLNIDEGKKEAGEELSGDDISLDDLELDLNLDDDELLDGGSGADQVKGDVEEGEIDLNDLDLDDLKLDE